MSKRGKKSGFGYLHTFQGSRRSWIFLGRGRARVYFYAKGKVGIMLFALRIACHDEVGADLEMFTKKIQEIFRMRIGKGLAVHVTCCQNVETRKKDRLRMFTILFRAQGGFGLFWAGVGGGIFLCYDC